MESKRTSDWLGIGITGGCELLLWVLGSELGFLGRVTSVLCCFETGSLCSSGFPSAGIKVYAATLNVLSH